MELGSWKRRQERRSLLKAEKYVSAVFFPQTTLGTRLTTVLARALIRAPETPDPHVACNAACAQRSAFSRQGMKIFRARARGPASGGGARKRRGARPQDAADAPDAHDAQDAQVGGVGAHAVPRDVARARGPGRRPARRAPAAAPQGAARGQRALLRPLLARPARVPRGQAGRGAAGRGREPAVAQAAPALRGRGAIGAIEVSFVRGGSS